MKALSFFVFVITLSFFTGCTSESVQPKETAVQLQFSHLVNGNPLEMDHIKYTNAVGQAYSIKTVKYIISRVTFHKSDGSEIVMPDIHYVDARDNTTLTYALSKSIPYGSYSSVSFVYGLVPEDNITGSLGLEMDQLMEWPVLMGGGYHYMKLEGEYVANDATNFFNFHSGSLDGVAYEIHVNLPNAAFNANSSDITLGVEMEISNWFQHPVDWDFAYWGSGIMGNPDAQATVQKNGTDVFSINFPESTL